MPFATAPLPDGSAKFFFIVPETPNDCWKKVIEPYEIKCDIVIDSHKGMGDWFENVPLYKTMRETEAVNLLPNYYFKGLYIKHDVPYGFSLLYSIPDLIIYQGRIADDWQKKIYEIDWGENKNCVKSASQ